MLSTFHLVDISFFATPLKQIMVLKELSDKILRAVNGFSAFGFLRVANSSQPDVNQS